MSDDAPGDASNADPGVEDAPYTATTASLPEPPSPLVDRWWLWPLAGALYGLLLRVLFGVLPGDVGVMSVAFALGTPFVLGALTLYGRRRRGYDWRTMLFLPWLTVGLMLAGCMVTLLEGAICLVIMTPLFLVLGSLGGVAMGLALRRLGRDRTELRAVALLPLLLILGDRVLPPAESRHAIRDAIEIDAPPAVVWREILDARDIREDELPFCLAHAIGVPRPIEGVNRATAEGEVRTSRWERGVRFTALVVHREEARAITWRYRFDADSFPPGSMDDHVAVGGRHFDMQDTTFRLQPLPGDRTRLEITGHYRVNTPFNFYAVPVADVLGGGFVHTLLGLYKGRSERAMAHPPTDTASQRT